MFLGAQPDMEIVGEAADGATAVARTLELRPDVVIMDIAMEGGGGVSATRQIKKHVPQTKVLVLTIHDDQEYLRQMLEAGATGYLLKEAADAELAVAVRTVYRGEIFIYPSFTRVLLNDLIQDAAKDHLNQQDSYERLSPREKEVLRLVALGHTNQQIADKLFLSIKTVESYRARVMQKLNLRNRTALVRYA
ncbi:MAG: response regulator transcription factor, partial [Chloroflexi bacterium]|nr:response regulator transcription factor [Chloroflexota bacterium]